ncbi:CRISPR-associated protein Cas5 [Dehalococcoidia bacterium]|nr:CRISPR-associated protein Cas5 [Dehalococcoidia bacterium]MCL0097820.1 CRISPR-associated protein Cas5 [Dehalococcoidia bacterium]
MTETIFALKACVRGAFASFKFEHDQRYHRTYELPPKTTLVGFLGAALGLSEGEVHMSWRGGRPLVERVRVAVRLHGVQGRVSDVWKITKNVPTKGRVEKAVITREQLYRPEYAIYVTAPDVALVNDIGQYLNAPVFPLSLGRDDELALVRKVERLNLKPAQPPVLLYNILLPFDLGQVELVVDLQPGRKMRPHLKQNLPHRFSIRNGVRHPADVGVFTFLTGCRVRVEADIEAYRDTTENGEINVVFL